jgi:hypothetical protein
LTVDKDGNIYIGDILGNTIQKFRKVSNDWLRSTAFVVNFVLS